MLTGYLSLKFYHLQIHRKHHAKKNSLYFQRDTSPAILHKILLLKKNTNLLLNDSLL